MEFLKKQQKHQLQPLASISYMHDMFLPYNKQLMINMAYL